MENNTNTETENKFIKWSKTIVTSAIAFFKKIPHKTKEIKNIFRSVFIVSITSGLIASIVIYFLSKADAKKAWCTQEVKSFQFDKYNKKDLAILIEECEDVVINYKLLEDILYESNNTDKFSSTINQLYVDKKIDESLILDFSDTSLSNYLNNTNYNFDNVLVNTKNNLPTLQEKISKYLRFTKEILFDTYTDIQQEKYFHILLYLFRQEILIDDVDIDQNTIYDLPQTHWSDGIPKLNNEIIALQKICQKVGRANGKETIVKTDDLFINTLMNLFNSYKEKNNKVKLLNNFNTLSSQILTYQTNLNKTSPKLLNEFFLLMVIYPLVLDELTSYNFKQKELTNIFNEYKTISKMIGSINRNTVNKLIYKLFKNNDKVNLYNQLILDNLETGLIVIDTQLVYFFAVNDNIDILNSLLTKNNLVEKRTILHAVIIEQKQNPYFGYSDINIVKKIIESEEDFDKKSLLIRDALLIDNSEITEIAINHIEENKNFYLQELNKKSYTPYTFNFSSIFASLAKSNTYDSILKKRKASLFFDLLQKTVNKENRIYLLKAVKGFIGNDDVSLIIELERIIQSDQTLDYGKILSELKI